MRSWRRDRRGWRRWRERLFCELEWIPKSLRQSASSVRMENRIDLTQQSISGIDRTPYDAEINLVGSLGCVHSLPVGCGKDNSQAKY